MRLFHPPHHFGFLFYPPLSWIRCQTTSSLHLSNPLVVYKNKNGSFIVHSDVCPHQGASLSKGWITKEGHLQCPYHGFEFDSGCFCESQILSRGLSRNFVDIVWNVFKPEMRRFYSLRMQIFLYQSMTFFIHRKKKTKIFAVFPVQTSSRYLIKMYARTC